MTDPSSNRIRPKVDAIFPINLAKPSGPCVTGKARILSTHGDSGVGRLLSDDLELSWLDEYEHFVFVVRPDGMGKAIRKATAEDIKSYRVPIWNDYEEIPVCCNQEMIFIGQLDDKDTWTAKPPDADTWWDDDTSFYIFTCQYCLECSAIGQQL